eukprot:m.222344 g.222344  ORF g.222344 m.222344 type:complete len:55 (+) comp39975_c3_seq7:1413-1577(+)
MVDHFDNNKDDDCHKGDKKSGCVCVSDVFQNEKDGFQNDGWRLLPVKDNAKDLT